MTYEDIELVIDNYGDDLVVQCNTCPWKQTLIWPFILAEVIALVDLHECTAEATMTTPYDYRIYHALDGWRWRCIAPNGEIIADSGEAYDTKSNAQRAIDTLKADMQRGDHQDDAGDEQRDADG